MSLNERIEAWYAGREFNPVEPIFDEVFGAARRWSEFPTDEDVEVGAKAMYQADDAYDLPWSDQSERNGVRDWYRDKVRAALSAVRARETGEQ